MWVWGWPLRVGGFLHDGPAASKYVRCFVETRQVPPSLPHPPHLLSLKSQTHLTFLAYHHFSPGVTDCLASEEVGSTEDGDDPHSPPHGRLTRLTRLALTPARHLRAGMRRLSHRSDRPGLPLAACPGPKHPRIHHTSSPSRRQHAGMSPICNTSPSLHPGPWDQTVDSASATSSSSSRAFPPAARPTAAINSSRTSPTKYPQATIPRSSA